VRVGVGDKGTRGPVTTSKHDGGSTSTKGGGAAGEWKGAHKQGKKGEKVMKTKTRKKKRTHFKKRPNPENKSNPKKKKKKFRTGKKRRKGGSTLRGVKAGVMKSIRFGRTDEAVSAPGEH